MPAAARAWSIARGACRATGSWPIRIATRPTPRSVKDEIELVTRIGMNVLAYATSRELKEKLDRPQITISNPGGKTPRGALVVPKLSHGGGADDAPGALNNLLTVMEKQLEMRVDYEKRMIAPTDAKLYDFPVLFMHGRRSFRFSAAERKALKDYLDRGGFLFADAICANKEFADSLRAELKAIYPEPSSHGFRRAIRCSPTSSMASICPASSSAIRRSGRGRPADGADRQDDAAAGRAGDRRPNRGGPVAVRH